MISLKAQIFPPQDGGKFFLRNAGWVFFVISL